MVGYSQHVSLAGTVFEHMSIYGSLPSYFISMVMAHQRFSRAVMNLNIPLYCCRKYIHSVSSCILVYSLNNMAAVCILSFLNHVCFVGKLFGHKKSPNNERGLGLIYHEGRHLQ